MKNHRFLWLRNRTTDNRKCEKARNIKEKRTIEMFNTVSRQLVAHLSSQRDNFSSARDHRCDLLLSLSRKHFCFRDFLVRPEAHVFGEARFRRDGLQGCIWLGRCICSGDASISERFCLQGCICLVEIIPAEEKSKLGMNQAERNHPCGEKEQTGDESGR